MQDPIKVSVLVAAYDMQRVLPRTLATLTPDYQRNVAPARYEVIVGENPSPRMVEAREVERFGDNFRYVRAAAPAPSPGPLINTLAREARGDTLLIVIDGARMLSPGVLRSVFEGRLAARRPIVAFHSFHLGEEAQQHAVAAGRYSEAIEDTLLAGIDWPNHGYRLFQIAVFTPSSSDGWFSPMLESNCIALPRASFEALGGFDERFREPGGGLVNFDFYERALSLKGHQLYHVLGEGTFHQTHGGASTSGTEGAHEKFHAEYAALQGRPWRRRVAAQPRYLGRPHPLTLDKLRHSVDFLHRGAVTGSAVADQLDKDREALGAVDPARLTRVPTIVVFGMHRSGTSTLAKLLTMAGAVVPGDCVAANDFNPEGYYEPREMIFLNNRIFSLMRTNWHGVAPLPEGWADREDMAHECATARGFLLRAGVLREGAVAANGHDDAPLYVLKDPRTCRLWPIWRRALADARGPQPRAVVITREPDEVAASLERRNHTDREHARLLWGRYMVDLLRSTRGMSRVVVDYEDLTSARRAETVASVFGALGLPFEPADAERLARAVDERPSSRPDRAAGDAVGAAYDAYRDGADLEEAMAPLAARFDELDAFAGGHLRAVERRYVVVERAAPAQAGV